jgi:hypothetical protein
MIRADEIFVKSDARERVTGALGRILGRLAFVSSAADVLPRTYMSAAAKSVRAFYVATSIDGWVCVLESYGGDEDLARELARELNTVTIWISYSDTVEILEYSKFNADGSIQEAESARPAAITTKRMIKFTGSRRRSQGENELIARATELFAKNRLPWPLYSFEQIHGSPNKDDYFVRMNFVKA